MYLIPHGPNLSEKCISVLISDSGFTGTLCSYLSNQASSHGDHLECLEKLTHCILSLCLSCYGLSSSSFPRPVPTVHSSSRNHSQQHTASSIFQSPIPGLQAAAVWRYLPSAWHSVLGAPCHSEVSSPLQQHCTPGTPICSAQPSTRTHCQRPHPAQWRVLVCVKFLD